MLYLHEIYFLALLRDAVKSGDYMTVKMALSSSEEYNLDQEVIFL